MIIRGGHTMEVYRTTRDRFGDGEQILVGTIENVVFQWASAASVGLRFHKNKDLQESSSLSAVVFAPRDAAIKLQGGDRIKFNDSVYQVVGDRAWDEDNPITGHAFTHYMMQVETTS